MINHIKNLFSNDVSSEIKRIFNKSKIGLEKESLRVNNLKICKSDHPKKLGSPLCNRFITTDFSEAQLELVTPPFKNKKKAVCFLDNTHQFVSSNIDDEILWPFSIPPTIKFDQDIRIAKYGRSNKALFKELYRQGLANRYGSRMQSISGLHVNYSLPTKLSHLNSFEDIDLRSNKVRSEVYFRMLRNLYRMNWLILYLFGASPILTKEYLNKESKGFKKIDNYTYYLPYATSLRMSDLGYQNAKRARLDVCTDSLDEYISDLIHATETICAEYTSIGSNRKGAFSQINSNILQIDDEYYSIARPKSSIISDTRLTAKLATHGVDYIELRSLDLNPFNRNGIDLDTIYFIELFFLYCLLKPSKMISKDENKEIRNNDLLVSKMGRKPKLYLTDNQKKVSLKNWAIKIVNEIRPIAELMDGKDNFYQKSLNKMQFRILESNETLSSKFLDRVLSEKLSFSELGNLIGKDNKKYFLEIEKGVNKNWDLLEKETILSLKNQKKLEADKSRSFEDFLMEYFSD